jgi:large subunit ribosomal protein L4
MELEVYKINGEKSGEKVELPDSIFNINPNNHAIYLSVKAYLANQRQGTHKTKDRSEVRGGGRKPWRQKGRGTARAGSIRSPLWVGGGTIFGPKPRDYREKVNKKLKVLAKKSVLSLKAQNNQILIVEDFKFDEIKTKRFLEILKALKIEDKKVCFVTNEYDKNIYLSARNIEKKIIRESKDLSVYDIANNQILMMQKSALNKIVNILK